jgi:hypothetical protein
MSCYVDDVYARDLRPRRVAVYGPEWQVIESHCLEPNADLPGAVAAEIERLAGGELGRSRRRRGLG